MHALQATCRRVASDPVHEKEQPMRATQFNYGTTDNAWRPPSAEELAAEDAVTREMMERDPSIERWLRDVAVPTALAYDASQALSVEQAREALAEMRRQRGWAT